MYQKVLIGVSLKMWGGRKWANEQAIFLFKVEFLFFLLLYLEQKEETQIFMTLF